MTSILLFACSSINSESSAKPETYLNENYNPTAAELKATGIPVVQISVTDGSSVTSKTEWKAASVFIDGSGCGEDDFEASDIQIKGRGNSSWALPKKPYTIKLSSKEKILGLPKSKKWVLIANHSDKTLLRNYFASYLGNSIFNSVWNPSFKQVHLIVNGSYQGVYLLGEQIKIEKNRVNIKDISETELDVGGFIFEINKRLDEEFNFKTERGVCISLKDPDSVSEEIQSKVVSVIQAAEDVLFSDDFADAANSYTSCFDIDSVIDWYIVNELTKNVDAANFSSIYLYYDASDRLIHMGPNWDFDISCGNVNYCGCDTYDGLYIKENSVWIKRMFLDEAFAEKVNARWNEKKIRTACRHNRKNSI